MAVAAGTAAEGQPWPPEVPGAGEVAATIHSPVFLEVPAAVQAAQEEQVAKFVVAETPPVVELAFHRDLGSDAIDRRLWSSWGDICVAGDGAVYCGIGDHGNDVGGDARCFLYRWNPRRKTLEQLVDMNQVVAPRAGQPAWSKVHARIDEGPDRKIYFSPTLNDGQRAGMPEYQWNEGLPGGQLYHYDPATGQTVMFADLPPRRCTATSILDRERNIWWCNLEAGQGDALWGLNLETKQPVFQSDDGVIAFNRNFALARDGSILFNGQQVIGRYDSVAGRIAATSSSFRESPGMRCSTRETKDGSICGITHRTNQLFRYHLSSDKLTLLGPNWLAGAYTTVCVLSPDERFLYYLPGAHGSAFREGTPVVQYEIATGRRKVLAFLAKGVEQHCGYVPAGTYGAKLSADGSTLYVNFNGHAADRIRPAHMRPNGFGLCAFAAIHIPAGER